MKFDKEATKRIKAAREQTRKERLWKTRKPQSSNMAGFSPTFMLIGFFAGVVFMGVLESNG